MPTLEESVRRLLANTINLFGENAKEGDADEHDDLLAEVSRHQSRESLRSILFLLPLSEVGDFVQIVEGLEAYARSHPMYIPELVRGLEELTRFSPYMAEFAIGMIMANDDLRAEFLVELAGAPPGARRFGVHYLHAHATKENFREFLVRDLGHLVRAYPALLEMDADTAVVELCKIMTLVCGLDALVEAMAGAPAVCRIGIIRGYELVAERFLCDYGLKAVRKAAEQ